ncbi:sulfide/dihydroorotate dehydrogenase-like FAD/NAD-binding protein [Methanofollis aquaemaris]|uniref:Sulfide/dihydroorotate dehydrogenase-like FAD/NAD-binding protein n=1 Tax=Methanofollis aquaemaris TaxID=126734 RepID=A0A8A3S8P0_9EURY|nr:sulfide/dihydroorotate dehydrogenase-like FAD/NAD-binding protein [Methanofollis aquaemaris]QSZ68273.1 sulfide/dihydroorotate dehydrogenase-like FAD/NAD-binding protein [Methanofollis aquaemaris]
MYQVEEATQLSENVYQIWVNAPQVARHARAGQFLIIRVDETGERIPLTISATKGDSVRVIYMAVGKTTELLATKKKGDVLADIVGPLGTPSEIKNYGTVVVIGGGVGIASTPIIAREAKEAGNHVIGIIGARNKDLLILEDEMEEVCDELFITTDDGSKGVHGFASTVLEDLLKERTIGCVWIVGPAIMMKVTSRVTIPYKVKTFVSLNPIMVDGTGMCGSCRVTVGGETKFACVDGPEFDAHQVDFDSLMQRQRMYVDEEKEAREHFHHHDHHGGCGCCGGKH